MKTLFNFPLMFYAKQLTVFRGASLLPNVRLLNGFMRNLRFGLGWASIAGRAMPSSGN